MPDEIPFCAPPDRNLRRPMVILPSGSCDTHAHVFPVGERYPFSPRRGYTPPPAPLGEYLRLHETLGVARGVLVQPSVYGTDNRAILDAVAQHSERLRAVAAVTESVSDAELARLDDAGVRGIRVNLADPGGMPFDSFAGVARMAERIAAYDWHLELLLHVHEFPDIEATLKRLPVPVVIGHFGYMPSTEGLECPGFRAFLALLETGRCWVKLTAPYRITARPDLPYDDVAPMARALVDVRPDRMLWGTDWPHPFIRTAVPMPNDTDLLEQFCTWVPDEAVRRRILVDNPAELYGFA